MKSSLMFSLLILSIFLNEAQGIRLEKWSISAYNYQKLMTENLSSDRDDGSDVAIEVSSGINRKLMTKIVSSSSTTSNDKNYKNDQRKDLKFSNKLVKKEETFSTNFVSSTHEKQTEVVSERYPDVIDITGMDYSPAKRKPPIHN